MDFGLAKLTRGVQVQGQGDKQHSRLLAHNVGVDAD